MERFDYKNPHKNREYLGRSQSIEKHKAELRENPTPAEIAFQKKLIKAGYQFIFQKGFFSVKHHFSYIVDFFLPQPYNLAIELDGYHHVDSYKQREEDKTRGENLIKYRNLNILRITNKEASSVQLPDLKRTIETFRNKQGMQIYGICPVMISVYIRNHNNIEVGVRGLYKQQWGFEIIDKRTRAFDEEYSDIIA